MKKQISILLIEDDMEIAEQIQSYLQSKGYFTEVAPTYLETLAKLDSFYDVVLMDINLPDGNAEDLVSKIKEKGIRIIVTTVKSDENFIVSMLDRGADDFLTKPFSLEILRARIDAVMRTISVMEGSKIIYNDLILDKTKAMISYQNHRIDMTSLEYAVLSLFIQNPNRVLEGSSLEDQFDLVTGDEIAAGRSMDMQVLMLIIGGIGLVILLLNITNGYASINLSLLSRKRQIGSLYSCGMEKEEMMRLYLMEFVTEEIRAIGITALITALVMIVVDFLFAAISMKVLLLYFPWLFFVVFSVLIYGVNLVIYYIALRNILKQPVIHLIQQE